MHPFSLVANLVIFIATAVAIAACFRKDGRWNVVEGLKALRYFTVLSNAFCAVAALVLAVGQLAGGVTDFMVTLKYLGTASVTVTFLTVMLFLGPTQGYGIMFSGKNLYMHLVGPLLAIVSFCLFEKGDFPLTRALRGVLPVAVYGVVYLKKVVYSPEDSRWEDFYGFNRGGKWPLAFGAMLLGALGVCVLLWAL